MFNEHTPPFLVPDPRLTQITETQPDFLDALRQVGELWGKELYRQHKTELIEFAETLDPKTIFAGGTVVTAIAGQLVDRGYIDEIPLPDIPLYERRFGDSVKIKQALESTWQLGDAPWELADDGVMSTLSTQLTIDLTEDRIIGRYLTNPINVEIDFGRLNLRENPTLETHTFQITFGVVTEF